MEFIKSIIDGNEAAAYISYAFTELAAIYPITPSSPMAEHVDRWAAEGRKNIFGQTVRLVEMQSEGGAAGAMHGGMEAGVLASSYTSSQGLMLMTPVMYRMAGYLKAGVIHVAARSVASHGYSITAEHSDVMACRPTGFAILASGSVQEVLDLGAVAHLSSIAGRVPFLHFFDGFRTSHEIQKVYCPRYEDLAELVDRKALLEYRKSALNPEYPLVRSPGESAEIYFQHREACTPFYDRLPDIVEAYMKKMEEATGRPHGLFQYSGAPDARHVLVAMGSVSGPIRETVRELLNRGEKVGFLEVHLFRPFSVRRFMEKLPSSVETVTVLDRTKEPGAAGDPLYQDVCTAVNEAGRPCRVLSGRYGLGGKDTTPSQILAAFKNAAPGQPKKPKNHFTVGIVDDLSHSSLPVEETIRTAPAGTKNCKFWGLGSDGTVGANKNSVKIIGEHTDMYVQAYFEYDGKKSGGVTKSHLRFSPSPIDSAYCVQGADFVACHNQTYLGQYDMISDLRPGGAFLINCAWDEKELEQSLPLHYKRFIAKNDIRVFTIDGSGISRSLGLGGHFNATLQAAFFKIIDVMPIEDVIGYMKEAIHKTYHAKGEKVVAQNMAAVEQGIEKLKALKIPDSWATISPEAERKPEENLSAPAESLTESLMERFVRGHLIPMNAQEGEKVTVKDFEPWADSGMPAGTSRFEKRGIAADVPEWQPDLCLQCNQCSLVCSHAAIRPFLLTEAETRDAPEGFGAVPARGKQLENFVYRIQVSALDCSGCGSCVRVCPAKEKALVMRPLSSQMKQQTNWDYAIGLPEKPNPLSPATVKGSQFNKPLLEFSGACAGCGETPYVKLLTQLFGSRMYIAAATGCSAVWSVTYPNFPYTQNQEGHGPALSNSLFENNGEFGLGIALGVEQHRSRLAENVQKLAELTKNEELRGAARNWLARRGDPADSKTTGEELARILRGTAAASSETCLCREILDNAEYLTKKSIWAMGGDGWAYDIGYGGLDHVLSLGADINILVLDTEVYSNTGGQASKASPRGAVAQFAAAGMKTRKKNLGMLAMEYEHVYVAQIAMGADYAQTVKAIAEAENYPGTSLVIAYAPCLSHGLKEGMSASQAEMKRAVEVGYWALYRRNPLLLREGKNPFILDSPEPKGNYRDFLL
jgi:pyruvate-ferredoxin/flavodoxin oxidoreductase